MKIKIIDFENKLGKKIKRNFISVGFDTAEKMGVGFIKTIKNEVIIDWELIEFDKSNIKQVYYQLTEESLKILQTKPNFCVIEDTYLKFFGQYAQADVFKKLTRFGGIILANTINNKIDYEIIGAKSARAKLFKLDTKKYKGKSKKAVKDYLESIGISIDEDNCADGILLAILGIIENMDFRTQKDIAKSKKKRKIKNEK